MMHVWQVIVKKKREVIGTGTRSFVEAAKLALATFDPGLVSGIWWIGEMNDYPPPEYPKPKEPQAFKVGDEVWAYTGDGLSVRGTITRLNKERASLKYAGEWESGNSGWHLLDSLTKTGVKSADQRLKVGDEVWYEVQNSEGAPLGQVRGTIMQIEEGEECALVKFGKNKLTSHPTEWVEFCDLEIAIPKKGKGKKCR